MMDKIRKQMIGNKEYNFKMTNKTIRKIDERYGNYASVIEGLMEGKQFYTNCLKLVSMSCIDKEKKLIDKDKKIYKEIAKEFDITELENILTGEQYQNIANSLAINLYLDYMGINVNDEESKTEKTESKESKKKN